MNRIVYGMAAAAFVLAGCHTITEELPTAPSASPKAPSSGVLKVSIPTIPTATPTPKPNPTPTPGPAPTPQPTPPPNTRGCADPPPTPPGTRPTPTGPGRPGRATGTTAAGWVAIATTTRTTSTCCLPTGAGPTRPARRTASAAACRWTAEDQGAA